MTSSFSNIILELNLQRTIEKRELVTGVRIADMVQVENVPPCQNVGSIVQGK